MTQPSVDQHHEAPGGFVFWTGMAIGAATVAFGLRGVLLDLRATRIANLSLFFGASGIAHDALWAPLLVVGGLVTRRIPQRCRRPLRVALALSLGLILFAWPVLAGPSTKVRNPTVLPLDYGRNLLLTLAALWAGCGVVVVRAYWMNRPRRVR